MSNFGGTFSGESSLGRLDGLAECALLSGNLIGEELRVERPELLGPGEIVGPWDRGRLGVCVVKAEFLDVAINSSMSAPVNRGVL